MDGVSYPVEPGRRGFCFNFSLICFSAVNVALGIFAQPIISAITVGLGMFG